MVSYSFKRRFVDPIRAGLGIYEPILGLQPAIVPPKRQTIRAIGKRRHARPGETLQLYHAMRTKQCFEIGEARCTSTKDITIAFSKRPNDSIISIAGITHYVGPALNDFAKLDGFSDWDDMEKFWEDEHGLRNFEGVLIQWEPL
jgi:hypothetical protein